MGGAEIQKIFDNKLKIAKDPPSKIFFKVLHSQLIKSFNQFLYLFISIGLNF